MAIIITPTGQRTTTGTANADFILAQEDIRHRGVDTVHAGDGEDVSIGNDTIRSVRAPWLGSTRVFIGVTRSGQRILICEIG